MRSSWLMRSLRPVKSFRHLGTKIYRPDDLYHVIWWFEGGFFASFKHFFFFFEMVFFSKISFIKVKLLKKNPCMTNFSRPHINIFYLVTLVLTVIQWHLSFLLKYALDPSYSVSFWLDKNGCVVRGNGGEIRSYFLNLTPAHLHSS